MDAHGFFNLGEAALWAVIAIVLLRKSVKLPTERKKRARWAALSFALFGASDLWEIQTGAWWTPWPLPLLKAGCVLSLVSLFRAWHQHKKKQ
ncbi:MAG: hypothetical protein AAF514_14585 [Verrucomicrobiota bacterium]